ncbi:MAG: hypothetical protein KGQ60_12115, partial [Planctomycetes bacterium]|nr:hypothetical protein [Planctomycetota bacterium]
MRSIDCYRCCWLIVSLFVATTFSGRLLADAKPEDVSAATKRVSALGKVAKVTMDGNKLTEIVISEGSQLTDADFLLFGKLTDLTKLQVLNCRVLNTENIKAISGLAGLKSLS